MNFLRVIYLSMAILMCSFLAGFECCMGWGSWGCLWECTYLLQTVRLWADSYSCKAQGQNQGPLSGFHLLETHPWADGGGKFEHVFVVCSSIARYVIQHLKWVLHPFLSCLGWIVKLLVVTHMKTSFYANILAPTLFLFLWIVCFSDAKRTGLQANQHSLRQSVELLDSSPRWMSPFLCTYHGYFFFCGRNIQTVVALLPRVGA